MEERRKYKRLDLDGELIMKPIGLDAKPEAVAISVINASRAGMGFQSDL